MSVILRKIRYIFYFSFFIFLSFIVFVRQGNPILQIYIPTPWKQIHLLDVYSGAVDEGLSVALRFLVIVLSSIWFVSTTNPGRMSNALMRHGLPFRYAVLMNLTLVFVPLFSAESSTVQNAQKARGLDIDVRGPRRMLKVIKRTYSPLLFSALSRVDAIALSMDSRGMGRSGDRTFLVETTMTKGDRIITLAAILLSAIALSFYWGYLPMLSIPSL